LRQSTPIQRCSFCHLAKCPIGFKTVWKPRRAAAFCISACRHDMRERRTIIHSLRSFLR
jgi:hypothetical protein